MTDIKDPNTQLYIYIYIYIYIYTRTNYHKCPSQTCYMIGYPYNITHEYLYMCIIVEFVGINILIQGINTCMTFIITSIYQGSETPGYNIHFLQFVTNSVTYGLSTAYLLLRKTFQPDVLHTWSNLVCVSVIYHLYIIARWYKGSHWILSAHISIFNFNVIVIYFDVW